MPDELLSDRVERLEKTVGGLHTLPAEVAALGERVGSVETQILQFRAEVHVEFSDVRGEMRSEFAAVRSEMQTEFAAVRSEMRTEFAAVRSEMQVGFTEVRGEMQTGFSELRDKIDENWQHTRALHEHLIAQIKTIGEHGQTNAPGGPPRTSRRKRSWWREHRHRYPPPQWVSRDSSTTRPSNGWCVSRANAVVGPARRW